MKAYIDTSAFVKTFTPERETVALKSFLDSQKRGFRLMSSLLLETEARRTAAFLGLDQLHVTRALGEVNLAEAPHSVFVSAGLLPGPGLRALDAIHVATALRHGVDLLVAYDRRLLEAARALGIRTASPT